jgi:hypothetical protein
VSKLRDKVINQLKTRHTVSEDTDEEAMYADIVISTIVESIKADLGGLKPDSEFLGCGKHWSADSGGACTCDENKRTYNFAHSRALAQVTTLLNKL